MNDPTLPAASPSPHGTADGRPGEPAPRSMRPRERVTIVHRGPATWSLLANEAEVLLGLTSPDWFALESSPIARRVKLGHQRSTWRISLESGRTIFAKVFDDRGTSLPALWQRWTHNAPAEREWRASLALRARNVPVVQPLALGVWNGPRRRFVLLTEGVNGALSLAQAWSALRTAALPPAEQSRTNKLISALARLWAVAHNLGFAHPDGHPENVLVFTPEGGGPAALFVDVAAGWRRTPSVRPSRPVGIPIAIHSLAQLDQSFRRAATRAQRLRFWRCYWSLRRDSANPVGDRVTERRLLRRLWDESAVHAATLARQRDRRMRRDGKYFAKLMLVGGWRATVTLQLERRHVFSEPHVPDRTLEQWRTLLQPFVTSPTSDVLPADDRTIRCVRCRPRGWPARVAEAVFGSWARLAFERCHRLRHRDIAAPLALAYLEGCGRLGLFRDSVLIVPAGPGCGCGEGAATREAEGVRE